MTYKKGDTVVCINAEESIGLTLHKVYVVYEDRGLFGPRVKVLDNNNNIKLYFKHRFELDDTPNLPEWF